MQVSWYYPSSRNMQHQMLEKILVFNTTMVLCYLHARFADLVIQTCTDDLVPKTGGC